MSQSDPQTSSQLLPLVYDELRRLAAQKLAHEAPGQTLQATALVHEAYLRLLAGQTPTPKDSGVKSGHPLWNSKGHFFAAAAEAMRRILVERARAKGTLKRGGQNRRIDFDTVNLTSGDRDQELLAIDEALEHLEKHDAQAAQLVKLRYFVGLTHQQAAEALGIGRRPADRLWALARAWLYQQLGEA